MFSFWHLDVLVIVAVLLPLAGTVWVVRRDWLAQQRAGLMLDAVDRDRAWADFGEHVPADGDWRWPS